MKALGPVLLLGLVLVAAGTGAGCTGRRSTVGAAAERGPEDLPIIDVPDWAIRPESVLAATELTPPLRQLRGHPVPPLAAARPALPRELLYSVLSDGRVVGHYAVDGHLHSEYSGDSRLRLRHILSLAVRRELDAVVITDHGSIGARGVIAALDASRPRGARPLVVLGEEAGSRDAHIGLWSVSVRNKPERWGMRPLMAQAVGFVDARNPSALIVLNHPGWFRAGVKHFLARHFDPREPGPKFDAIEIWNGRRLLRHQTRALVQKWEEMLALGLQPSIVSGSDSHDSKDVGSPRTVVLATSLDAAALVEAARAGRTYLTDDARVSFSVAGHFPGETIDARRHRPPWKVRVAGVSEKGGSLRLYAGREILAARWIEPRKPFALDLVWSPPEPARDGYLRVEIVRKEWVVSGGESVAEPWAAPEQARRAALARYEARKKQRAAAERLAGGEKRKLSLARRLRLKLHPRSARPKDTGPPPPPTQVDFIGLLTAPVYFDVGPQGDFWQPRPRPHRAPRVVASP